MKQHSRTTSAHGGNPPKRPGWCRNLTVLPLVLAVLACLAFHVSAADYSADQRDHVRVGFFAMDGYHMMDEAGNKSGYGYDLLRMMARYWDVEYKYVGYNKCWNDTQKQLDDG